MVNGNAVITMLSICICTNTICAQPVSLLVGNGSFITGGNSAYIHITGDIRSDGIINSDALSNWNFEGAVSQQRITCLSASGCTNIYNTDNYNNNLGNLNQYNANGISIEENTVVQGVHSFINGSTEIKEGNYWLTQTSAMPYDLNDNTGKFFVTTGHGLLKQSNVNVSGTFYPVGSATGADGFTPVTFSYAGAADTFGVRVLDNIYYTYDDTNGDGIGGTTDYRFVTKTWIVKKSNRFTGDVFTITPQWNLANEEANFTARRPTDICIARHHDAFWVPDPIQGPAAPPTGSGPFAYTGLVTYDTAPWEYYPVSVTAINTILAVTGLKFSGVLAGNNVLLKWATLSETNTSFFQVQRSENAVKFITIGKVYAAGTTVGSRAYYYTDALLPNGNGAVYYRLKQVDKNGYYRYSSTVIIARDDKADGIKIYPNPSKDDIRIVVKNATGRYTIKLADLSGKLLKTVSANVLPGMPVHLRCVGLAAGVYSILIINENSKKVFTKKVVITR